MSDNKDLFDEVIRNLRSVLLSNKDGLTARKLQYDYKELICEDIPYRKLGYQSLEDFLMKIPTVVYSQFTTAGFLWFGIADKKSEHIKEMIECQNSRRSKGGYRSIPLRRSYSQNHYEKPSIRWTSSLTFLPPKPLMQQAPKIRIDIPRFQKQFQQVIAEPKKKEIPQYIKNYIKLLFEMYPGGICISQFIYIFKNHFHEYLKPEDYGYSNLEDFVFNMPDVIRVRNAGSGLFLYGVGNCSYGTRNREWKSDIAENETKKSELVNTKKDVQNEMKSEYNLVNTKKDVQNEMKSEYNLVNTKKDVQNEMKFEDNLSQLMSSLNMSKDSQKKSSEHEMKKSNFDWWENYGGCEQTRSKDEKKNETRTEKIEQEPKFFEYKSETTKREHSMEDEWERFDEWAKSLPKDEKKNETKPNLNSTTTTKKFEQEIKPLYYKPEMSDSDSEEERKSQIHVNATTENEKIAKKRNFKIDSDIEESDDCNVSKRLKMEFRQLLKIYPKGIKSNSLPTCYRKEFNKELDYQGLGYISLPSLINDVTDIFFSYRESRNSDWLLLDARKCTQFGRASFTAESSKPLQVPEVIKKSIIKLLINKPKGILLGQFREEYINFLHQKVPYEDYGFRSLRHFLEDMTQDTIELEETIHGTLVKLLPTVLHKYLPALSGNIEEAVHRLQPMDIVKQGEEIPLQPLPAAANENKYFEIVVSEITSPYDFYFYLRGKETSVALEKLMNTLEFYHEPAGSNYIVPAQYLKPGLICAALYEKKDWHRARIIEVGAYDVSIFYLDYGTIGILPKSDIRFLRTIFTKLPVQAHAARLWNVEPYEKEWSKAARIRFFSLLVDKMFCVKLVGTKVKPISKMKVLELYMVYTLTDDGNDLDVAKCLVDEGHCRYSDTQTKEETTENIPTTTQPSQPFICNQPFLPYNMSNLIQLQTYANCYAMSNWLLNSNQFFAQQTPQMAQSGATATQSTPGIQISETSPKSNVKTESEVLETIDRKTIKNSPKNANREKSLDNLCNVLETLTLKRYVKVIKIGEKKMHLILRNKELYTISKDISQFLWNIDLLRPKLRLKHFKSNSIVINETDYPELFTELMNYNLCGEPLEVGLPHALIIYPLKRVPDIIDLFNPKLTDLKTALLQELDQFDPNDAYWGNSDDGISVGEPWDALDEIEVGLQVIKSRKHAIERELLNGFKQTLIDELNFVNDRIEHLQKEKLK